jgi:hypothetical protein
VEVISRDVTWKLEEVDGGWTADPLYAEVTQILVDFAFSMVIDQEIHLRVGTQFEYFDGSTVRKIEPERTPDQAPLLSLFNTVVLRIRFEERTDRVLVDFADGRWIQTSPHPAYESFSLHVPRSTTPFGGLFHGIPGFSED